MWMFCTRTICLRRFAGGRRGLEGWEAHNGVEGEGGGGEGGGGGGVHGGGCLVDRSRGGGGLGDGRRDFPSPRVSLGDGSGSGAWRGRGGVSGGGSKSDWRPDCRNHVSTRGR